MRFHEENKRMNDCEEAAHALEMLDEIGLLPRKKATFVLEEIMREDFSFFDETRDSQFINSKTFHDPVVPRPTQLHVKHHMTPCLYSKTDSIPPKAAGRKQASTVESEHDHNLSKTVDWKASLVLDLDTIFSLDRPSQTVCNELSEMSLEVEETTMSSGLVDVEINAFLLDFDDVCLALLRCNEFITRLKERTFYFHPNQKVLGSALQNVKDAAKNIADWLKSIDHIPQSVNNVALTFSDGEFNNRLVMLHGVRDFIKSVPEHDINMDKAVINLQLAYTRLKEYKSKGELEAMPAYNGPDPFMVLAGRAMVQARELSLPQL